MNANDSNISIHLYPHPIPNYLQAAAMNLSIERSPTLKFRLHIIIGSLVSVVFILIIARIANNGTPKTRTNIWGIAVVSKLPSTFNIQTTNHTQVPQISSLHGLPDHDNSYESAQTMGKHESIHDLEHHRYSLLVCFVYYHYYGNHGIDY